MSLPLTYAHVLNLILAAEKVIALTGYPSRKDWGQNMPESVDDARMQLITQIQICKLRVETDLSQKNVAKDWSNV